MMMHDITVLLHRCTASSFHLMMQGIVVMHTKPTTVVTFLTWHVLVNPSFTQNNINYTYSPKPCDGVHGIPCHLLKATGYPTLQRVHDALCHIGVLGLIQRVP